MERARFEEAWYVARRRVAGAGREKGSGRVCIAAWRSGDCRLPESASASGERGAMAGDDGDPGGR